jgi:hypothetical protein
MSWPSHPDSLAAICSLKKSPDTVFVSASWHGWVYKNGDIPESAIQKLQEYYANEIEEVDAFKMARSESDTRG